MVKSVKASAKTVKKLVVKESNVPENKVVKKKKSFNYPHFCFKGMIEEVGKKNRLPARGDESELYLETLKDLIESNEEMKKEDDEDRKEGDDLQCLFCGDFGNKETLLSCVNGDVCWCYQQYFCKNCVDAKSLESSCMLCKWIAKNYGQCEHCKDGEEGPFRYYKGPDGTKICKYCTKKNIEGKVLLNKKWVPSCK